ncbi:hypothetical protein [Streptomyces vinaceus]|uniref:hypothetical protein n=1 Tax=Streptomyces vinaceus TaxID=1960 RepID=UPI0038308D90
MPPSFVHRITKYDPVDRDERGQYTGAEETVSDHGPVEAAYLAAVAAFAEASGVTRLRTSRSYGQGFVVSGVRPVMLSKPSSIETVHDLVSAAAVTVRP